MTAGGAASGPPAVLAVDCRCTLGEGLLWWADRESLIWTDIHGARLWRHSVASAETRSWALPGRLGSMAICTSGALLLAMAKGLCFADLDAATGEEIQPVPIIPLELELDTTRVNDGRTDRAGNFVFGTMNEDPGEAAIGSFYQYSTSAGLRRLDLGGVHIPNSICFSLDGRTMYFCDSNQRRIMQCDYDAAAASVANLRAFAALGPGSSTPDGSVIDADGRLWNAEWGAARICRYDERGQVERSIRVPAKNPTCPAFGGPSLDDLYVTSAREQMTPEELAAVPDAGSVYRARSVGVRGVPDALFKDH